MRTDRSELWKVIGASSAGTLIEWYDFYLFGSLAMVISTKFFPDTNPAAAFLSTLATFAAGFVVRPFGAMFFGHLGDVIGRKYTFLMTLLIMGGATFAIGVIPSYSAIGVAAPILVLLLRLLQGLALGGEYGGAATYVAEHSPQGERGYWTSWIQTTATLGLFVSLAVILGCRSLMSAQAFNDWGWRIPFLLSIVLVGLSYVLRRKMKESPVFAAMKTSGKASANPIRESFGNKENLRYVLIALLGATAGQGVVWYTGQFYALTFLQKTLAMDQVQANIIIGAALLATTPLFVVMGALSDKVGRKPIMMLGCALAVVLYLPCFHGMAGIVQSAGQQGVAQTAAAAVAIERAATPQEVQGGARPTDLVRVETDKVVFTDGSSAVRTTTTIRAGAVAGASAAESPRAEVKDSLVRLSTARAVKCWLIVCVLVTLVTMVYGPIAAFLVELFPTRIRYTSMSLPYHIGNGVFGGMVPFVATWLSGSALAAPGGTLATLAGGRDFVGLLYPISIALLTLVVGLIWLPSKSTEADGQRREPS
ncbi:MAG: MFS transporter [Planctomycetota bacterium]|nr:MFS transporter [Planctomycetota bacterium]